MKKSISFTAAIFFALTAAHVTAAPKKLPYSSDVRDRFTFAVPLKKAPVIDGKLEAEVWGKVPQTKYFQVGKQLTKSVTKPTSFRIGYDSKYLYLAATMWESAPDLIKEGSRVQDGWPLTDRINFIFSKKYDRKGGYQDSPYIFLMFGAGGIHRGFYNEVATKVEKPLQDDAQEWITAYSKDDKHWYIESRVPLKLLGLDPVADKEIFLNVRRDNYTGPKAEAQSQWSATVSPKLAAHSFGTLYFQKHCPNKPNGLEERINGRSKYWYLRGLIQPLRDRKGLYIAAKQAYGDLPGWQEAEKLVDRLKETYAIEAKKNVWIQADSLDDLFMEWQQILRKLDQSAPTTTFKINTKNAKVLSVLLNGNKIPAKNGAFPLALISGMNKLEIIAESKGNDPGVKFDLQSSPETGNVFTAAYAGAKEKDFKPAAEKNGYLWSGNHKKVVFRQNLIWNRTYGGHNLSFIGPLVKEWGVSPGETMFFLHAIYNPKETGKCDYTLIAEVPEGFTRINDRGIRDMDFRHWPSKDVKSQKITYKGKKYVRYTFKWKVPEKLVRNLNGYVHHLSFRHDGYKFKKGEKVDFRFRRVVDGDTTDIVNVIKVAELPPIKGGDLKKIMFTQYDVFMGAMPSREQYKGMADDAFKAGLRSVIMTPDYRWSPGTLYSKERKFHISCWQRKGAKNYNSANFNLPLWGAGKSTYTAELVRKTPDLRATYYKNSGPRIKNWHNEFCLTNVTGKYRKQFKAALKKDYEFMIANNGISRDFFFNDENYPAGDFKNWQHSYCYCNVCKADFRAMFKIPANVKLTDETIITDYPAQWSRWWKHKQKNKLLALVRETVNELGGKVWYYHNTHDADAYKESKGLYDLVSIPLPGQRHPSAVIQADMDSAKQQGEKITGCHNSVGQFHTYWPKGRNVPLFSSDGFYLYPQEAKMTFVRMAATTHMGALIESAHLCSAGMFYYIGEATRLIAAYEDLFYDGIRADDLVGGTDFKYPNALVLKKGDERLVLLFNEDKTKAKTGYLKNLKLKPGQKATIWGSKRVYTKPAQMKITVKPMDVVAIHIK